LSINIRKSKTNELEAQIMNFLRQNRGRACTKEEIAARLRFLPSNFYRVKSVESLTDALTNVSIMHLVQEAINRLLKEEKIVVKKTKNKLAEEPYYILL